jgi:hypothetical protein
LRVMPREVAPPDRGAPMPSGSKFT